jgi:hypothetical protein
MDFDQIRSATVFNALNRTKLAADNRNEVLMWFVRYPRGCALLDKICLA